jgi:hypothetical protein
MLPHCSGWEMTETAGIDTPSPAAQKRTRRSKTTNGNKKPTFRMTLPRELIERLGPVAEQSRHLQGIAGKALQEIDGLETAHRVMRMLRSKPPTRHFASRLRPFLGQSEKA